MTVEREFQGFSICCDSCSDYVEVESPDHNWGDVKAAIRREDYRATLTNGVWEHKCPTCREDL
jgi:hypothetical protein